MTTPGTTPGTTLPPDDSPAGATWPTRRARLWTSTVALVLLIAAALVVPSLDLEPRVESEFFFASDDPQLQASQAIGRQFPTSEQLLLIVEAPALGALASTHAEASAEAPATGPTTGTEANDTEATEALTDPLTEALERVRALSDSLAEVDGVTSVRSLTHGPATPRSVAESPLWRRLLGTPTTNGSTQIVVSLADDVDPRALVPAVEDVVRAHRRPGFDLAVSGVPWVVERIRLALGRDLRVFSLGALALFALVLAAVVRVPRHVVGALLACLGACAASLVLLRLLGASIGLLTANLAAIVFVLTLSHAIFLLANHRAASRDSGADTGDDAARAVRRTLPASAWAAGTTLLGFASLLTASAAPLRELGFAGAIGTAVAFLTAYSVMPAFLVDRRASVPGRPSSPASDRRPREPRTASRLVDPRLTGPIAGALAVLIAVCAVGLPRVDTDPTLLEYFDRDTALHDSLARVDAVGGSSPLLLVVARADGRPLLDPATLDALAETQRALETDPAVGTALSLPVLLDEARRVPFAGFLPIDRLLAILDGPAFGRVASSFIDAERTRALVFLRLREAGRSEPRRAVVERLRAVVEATGLEVTRVGGLYQLQASLGELVGSSVTRSLLGLLALFALVATALARTLPRPLATAAAMVVALLGVPIVVLGGFGLAGAPLDLISSPAASVALALGIDSMIHLVSAVRRLHRHRGLPLAEAWTEARATLGPSILAAALILAAGFGLFGLSSFPPTRRFGIAVAVGTTVAAALALYALPLCAGPRLGGRLGERGS